MGNCQGNRNSYSNPMQKACTSFENNLRLYYRDWKMMVAAIKSYCPEDGSVPEYAMKRIMEEVGMTPTYEDKKTHLKDLMEEFLKERSQKQTWLIYFTLFMCDGGEASKMEYLCWTLNDMNMEKTTVSGEALREVLTALMKLSVQTIPAMGEVKDYKEDIYKQSPAELVAKWYPDYSKETLTIDEVRAWGVKCHNFTTGEARATVLKVVLPDPAPKPAERKPEQPTVQTAPSKEPTLEKTVA